MEEKEFDKMLRDLNTARKLNRQSRILSVAALMMSMIALIIRIVMALR